jgi:phosphoglycolate phosphatase
MPLSCLLFDLDGTLVDSRADLVASVNLMLGDFGRAPLPSELVAGMVGEGARKLVERALSAALGVAASDDAVADGLASFRRHYAAHLLDSTRPYPSVAETLCHFAETPKAVVTNKPLDFTEAILEGLGLRGHFAAVLGGECLPERKPSGAPLLEALRRCGVAGPPSGGLMVGDSAVDILSGKAAGVPTCGFTGGF